MQLDTLLLELDIDREVGLVKEVVDGQVGNVLTFAIRDQVPQEIETRQISRFHGLERKGKI